MDLSLTRDRRTDYPFIQEVSTHDSNYDWKRLQPRIVSQKRDPQSDSNSYSATTARHKTGGHYILPEEGIASEYENIYLKQYDSVHQLLAGMDD